MKKILLRLIAGIILLYPLALNAQQNNKTQQDMKSKKVVVKQTAGRDRLGEFAPAFARINDDVLFGEVWSRNDLLSLRDRSLVTVVALMSQGITDSSFKDHLETAKRTVLQKRRLPKS